MAGGVGWRAVGGEEVKNEVKYDERWFLFFFKKKSYKIEKRRTGGVHVSYTYLHVYEVSIYL